ncbi:transporter substrate-binding domain-containing protein [Roseobacter weihaiensis]|uniref:transporter substrate-binding domain-containing protein n=1 Tax=Roseobacter weihaiensis TaxID=2763262 RepID=UPI001D0B6EF1|nr:transporter substrate-binding domain-containing protein [Roseobacter sp. H9]
MHLIFVLFILLLSTLSAQAQDGRVEPLVVSFLPIPPFAENGPDGERAGFLVDLAGLIGSEIGIPIEYLDVRTSQEFVEAQASGKSDMIAGVAALPALVASNVFSEPVATERLRFSVLEERAAEFAEQPVTGQRIGIVPPAVGSEIRSLFETNERIEFQSPEAAVMGLLTGTADALLVPEPAVYSIARKSRVDGRIRFAGEPLRQVERFIALHQSRAGLIGPVNAAIQRIKDDGRLNALLLRYSIIVPPPAPAVLKVGVFDLPPHMMLDADGNASGFAIDVLRQISDLAGLRTEFVPIDMQDLNPGKTHDIIPIMSITDERKELMDFAYPIESSQFSIFKRKGETAGIGGLEDLTDQRVAVLDVSLAKSLAEKAGIGDLKVYSDGSDIQEMLSDLLNNDIDAILFEVSNVRSAVASQGLEKMIAEVTPPFFVSQRAPALRFGLGGVREHLNAVIPGYLISSEYANLYQKYFGEPVFWSRTRVITALAGLGVFLLVIAGAVISVSLRNRARQAERALIIRDEFETIFNVTTSGIIALDKDGEIARISKRARHMLGGISDLTPFAWPEAIKFLEAETLQPLEASADPVRRILSGNYFTTETHLMRHTEYSEEPRYVRVNSALVNNENSALQVVIVLDDVSQEERNRQVVERKSRLDALGQLTGGIAHDFNNLLASQLYAIDLARKATVDTKRDSYLEVIAGSIQRGRALTSRLLAFARKQPGLASVKKTADIFDDFGALVRPMLEAHIELSLETEDPELRHYCDHTQLETALMNLVLNSRDAILRAGEGSRIDIRARAVRSPNKDLDSQQRAACGDAATLDGSTFRYVEISVADNGPGMDDETLARCTDPFFTTKDTNSGTGLGLAMVYGFVRQSDGDLRIYSEVDVGTTVQLTLPRGTELGTRELPVPEEQIAQGSGETILVVEDELQLLVMITDVLEDLGYEVISARSGQDALQMIADGEEFDLLLTDIVMPGKIGGFELARRMRALRPDVPVIYTSGYTGFTASEMGEVQAPLLQKPAPPAELAEAISQALSKTS